MSASGGGRRGRRRGAERARLRAHTPAPRPRAWPWWVLLPALLAALVAAYLLLRARGGPEGPVPLPPPPPLPADTVAFADFAGAEACRACHASVFEAWRSSTHGRAGGPPSRDLLVRPFDGRPIRFRDATVTPRVERDGTHVFVVAQAGRAEAAFRVDGVVGGAHMIGGGTQGFVTRWADGSLRLLPFELERRDGAWFCNTATRLDGGWLPITPDLALADCGDWPPSRALGLTGRLTSCQECHGSQIEVAPEPGRPYATRFTSLSINCESCHGPGARHIALMQAPGADTVREAGLASLASLYKDASVLVCMRCHALKDELRPGDLPGRRLEAHYSLRFPLLDAEPAVHADGRPRTFSYQQGHYWSDCYLNGGMTCVDCHDPHGQGYRDVFGRPLADRFADEQCTACHASKALRPETHTHHGPGSAGSRCVACHMPFLQQPDVGDAIEYGRSDHTIAIPRPAFDAALGVAVACAVCHADRTVDALEAQAVRWYAPGKPHHPTVAGLAALAADASRAAVERLLVSTDTGRARHRMAEFTVLGRWLTEHAGPDASRLDRTVEGRLLALAADGDPDLAAAALAALHYTRGHDARARQFLHARLNELGDAEPLVRDRWALLLGFVGDARRAAGRSADAFTAYRRALEVSPDDPDLLHALAAAYAAAGDWGAAARAREAALRVRPADALGWVNLGIARAATGNAAGATAAYEAALGVDPHEPLAHFNLGNAHLRAGRTDDAVAAYTRAAAADPSLAEAHFNLARALAAAGRLPEARAALLRGLEFDRDNPGAREAVDEIDRALGRGGP